VKRVEHVIRAQVLGVDGEVVDTLTTTWRYDQSQPHHVTVTFECDTVWRFPRALMSEGVVRPAGHGDVRFTPEAGMVRMFLDGDGSAVTLEYFAVDLTDFLDDASTVLAEGAEPVDVDAGIRLLLSPTFRSAVR
jgi:hypothetical protein